MLQNAYFVAKIGDDTAENEQHFAEILPTDALWRLCRRELGGEACEARLPLQRRDARGVHRGAPRACEERQNLIVKKYLEKSSYQTIRQCNVLNK